MGTKTETDQEIYDDAFSEAFDMALEESDDGTPGESEESADTSDEEKATDDSSVEDTADESSEQEELESQEEPSPVAAESKPPESQNLTIDAGALVAAIRGDGAQGSKEQETAEPELTVDGFMSEEDKKFLADHDEEDWTEARKAMEIRHKAELQLTRAEIARDLKKEFESDLAPLTESVQKAQVEAHFREIRSSHEDFDTLLPDVEKWIETQPEIHKNAYNAVLDTGTAQQVVALFTIFKEANGMTAGKASEKTGAAPKESPASSGAKSGKATTKSDEPDPDAVAATAAVTEGKRTESSTAVDPDDYEGALAEAIGSI